MERHFGKAQEEQEAATEHKEIPAHPPFGHAPPPKPGAAAAPKPQPAPVKHAERIVPKIPDAVIENGSDTPALKKYLISLNDPHAIPTIESAFDHGDAKYRERIEQYVEQISKEIYSKVDARTFAMENHDEVRKSIAECVDAVLQYRDFNLTPAEKSIILRVLESDILGLGPLDELLADDDISDIMVDGPNEVFVEMNGQIYKTGVHFRSEDHLLNVCRRIVERVGRHVDKASPICDARLPDGSRVNVILEPLSIKGSALTIRKFKKERLTLDKLVTLGTVDARTAALLEIIAACRVNLLITGGTGSGKTTLLNCLTRFISPRERVITCEDAAELQLQQPQVVSLETRPTSAEGVGLITMRDLVRNCLRMRPDRIIVGEVRGPEAFDLLQAMNTGHDGSMGTFHANSTRDALFRLENMVAMANLSIPVFAIREQIASSLEIFIHTQRLRDGSRKVMNISEIVGMEDEMISLQDLVSYEMTGEDEKGRITGEFRYTHLHPRFLEKVRHYGLERDLLKIINED
ncbi:MAG: CpaF family protein [Alphaproteobacteria bacterium]|nr:MAG: CpaF family protein [Alphaproteobacteria bacterium]